MVIEAIRSVRPPILVVAQSRPVFHANAVESSFLEFHHPALQIIEEAIGRCIEQSPDPERDRQSVCHILDPFSLAQRLKSREAKPCRAFDGGWPSVSFLPSTIRSATRRKHRAPKCRRRRTQPDVDPPRVNGTGSGSAPIFLHFTWRMP